MSSSTPLIPMTRNARGVQSEEICRLTLRKQPVLRSRRTGRSVAVRGVTGTTRVETPTIICETKPTVTACRIAP